MQVNEEKQKRNRLETRMKKFYYILVAYNSKNSLFSYFGKTIVF